MTRADAPYNGVPALTITFPDRRGIVVVLNMDRNGYPGPLDSGTHFCVYPFGLECGVAITHSFRTRVAITKACGQGAADPGAAELSDDDLVDLASREFLLAAERNCSDFDPMLTDGSLLGNGEHALDVTAMHAGAHEHNHEIGTKIYDRFIASVEKQQRKRNAKAAKARQQIENNRQRREIRLVKHIARFRSLASNLNYRHFLWLRVKGADVYATMDAETIGRRSAHQNIIEVRRWLTHPEDRTEALRWVLRGLSVNLAIRKVIADSQERTLRESGAEPAYPSCPTKTYSYRRVA